MSQRLFSVKDAASYAAVSYGTIYAAVRAYGVYKLPAYRLKAEGKSIKRILIEKGDLDAWIDRVKEEYAIED